MSTPTKILHLIGDDGGLETEENISTFIKQEIAVDGNHKTSSSSNNSNKAEEDAAEKDESSDNSYEVISTPNQVGLNYRVIGVFGGQSSGKSTLLNRVFGTTFETMDQARGRQQTTKGAFLSKAPVGGDSNVFVMDFEGTDGVERGEDQSFERQLSLFALSCADTLIINMWCQEVGRFNGANLALLRTVFEVNLQLFAHVDEEDSVDQRDKEKPTLLFVLRDWDGSQEKEALYGTVNKSLNLVWEKVTRPKKFEDSTLRDLFDIKFEALPHYKFQKEEFSTAVEALKGNFVNPKSEGYLFKSNETFRGVPLEALPQYLTSCWDSIRESKDLNIPSQRQMLAQVRCGEASAAAIQTFKDEIATPFSDRIKKMDLIPVLSRTLENKIAELLVDYQKATKLYACPAAVKLEEELKEALEKAAEKLVALQCRAIANDEMERCETKVQKLLDAAIKGLNGQSEKVFAEAAEAEKNGKFDWAKANTDIIADFWEDIRSGVDDLVEDLKKVLAAKGEGKNSAILNADPEGLSHVLLLLKEAANRKIEARIEALAADPQAAMTKQFEHALEKDSNGLLRTFRTKSAFEKAYKPAVHTGILMLCALFAVRLSGPATPIDKAVVLSLGNPADGEAPTYPTDAVKKLLSVLEQQGDDDDEEAAKKPAVAILLSKDAVARAHEMYMKECTFTMKLRLQQIDQGSKALPAWVYAALLFLGFNEFYYALTNPVVLIVLIMVSYFFLQNFFQEQWGVLEEKSPGTALALKTAWANVEPHVAQLKAKIHGTPAPPTAGGGSHKDKEVKAKKKQE